MRLVVMVAFEAHACVPVSKPVFLNEASYCLSCHCQDMFLCKNWSYKTDHFYLHVVHIAAIFLESIKLTGCWNVALFSLVGS
jgi:hypothetical protein